MSRVPFDRNAKRYFSPSSESAPKVGFKVKLIHYLFIFPKFLCLLRPMENSPKISIWLPISCSLSKDLKKSLIKLSVIIPSRDEAENLGECISKIAHSLSDHCIENEILVIDDGSTDNTAEIVKDLRVQFLASTMSRTKVKMDLVVQFDWDCKNSLAMPWPL